MMASSQTALSHFETFIQRGFLDNRERKVVITKEYIEFEDKNRIDSENSRLYWKDFDAIRYGNERIRGYSFYIGLKRQIFIQDSNKNQIKISLTSLYSFRHKKNHEKFSEILNTIFNSFLNSHVFTLIELVKSGQKITLAGVEVSKDEVAYHFKKELLKIDFLVLNIASYKSYFYIYSEIDKERSFRVNFLEDWNSMLLYSVIKNFLKNKFV